MCSVAVAGVVDCDGFHHISAEKGLKPPATLIKRNKNVLQILLRSITTARPFHSRLRHLPQESLVSGSDISAVKAKL
jgi:hypothetical protein